MGTDILEKLFRIKQDAQRIIKGHWVTLAKIRAEFFAALAAQWTPLATELGQVFVGKASAQPTSPAIVSPIAEPSPALGLVVDAHAPPSTPSEAASPMASGAQPSSPAAPSLSAEPSPPFGL